MRADDSGSETPRSAAADDGLSPAEQLNRLWPAAYDELRRLAHQRLMAERTDHTLSPTALVHEVYLRLLDQRTIVWADRAAFFVEAGRAMRRILVDYARRHRALRRGGGRAHVRIDALDPDESFGGPAMQLAAGERADELLALDEALGRLARLEPRLARVVECRYFAGLTEMETAEALGVTDRTVRRDWLKARAWLYEELSDAPQQDGRS